MWWRQQVLHSNQDMVGAFDHPSGPRALPHGSSTGLNGAMSPMEALTWVGAWRNGGYRSLEDVLWICDHYAAVIPAGVLLGLLARLRAAPHEWYRYVRVDVGEYPCVTLRGAAHYEAQLLCWRSGEGSGIHDHGRSSCAVRVLHGRATEVRYVLGQGGLLRRQASRVLEQGSVSISRHGGIQELLNSSPDGVDLYSLRVLSPPLSKVRRYDCSGRFDGHRTGRNRSNGRK